MSTNDTGGSGGGPCGACKFLRRKCIAGCIFAPYFDTEHGTGHFAAVHKVFGASNVSKMLQQVPVNKRMDAAVTMCYEAQARLRDPVYGCVSNIFALQQQVANLQAELSYLQAHLATLELPIPPPAPPSSVTLTRPPLSLAALPSPSSVPISFELATPMDPLMQPAWTRPQMQMDFRQYVGNISQLNDPVGCTSDLQALAGELLQRRGITQATAPPPPPPPATSAPPPPLSG